jgi:hypothetical protein
VKKELRSTTLTVAVLVVFFGFSLPLAALLWLVLTGLAALLALSRLATLLSVLTALLALSILPCCPFFSISSPMKSSS